VCEAWLVTIARRRAVDATWAADRRPAARASGAAIEAVKNHSHSLVPNTQEVCPA